MKKLILLALTTLAVQAQFLLDPYRFAVSTPEYPLNLVTNVAWAGYSVSRKLNENYTLNCFQAYDGTNTANIGFNGDVVDTNALVTFLGGGTHNIYVRGIYNQVDDSVAGTRGLFTVPASLSNYPLVVTNGNLILDSNGRLAAAFPTANAFIRHTVGPGPEDVTNTHSFFVTNPSGATVAGNVFCQMNGTSQHSLEQRTGPNRWAIDNGGSALIDGSYITDTQYLVSLVFSKAGDDSIQINDNAVVSGAAGNNQVAPPCIGEFNGASLAALQTFSEWLIYTNSVLDEALIRDNVNDFYTLW